VSVKFIENNTLHRSHSNYSSAVTILYHFQYIQGGPKKTYKVYCIRILKPVTVSRGFHHNAQKLTINTRTEKILILHLNIL